MHRLPAAIIILTTCLFALSTTARADDFPGASGMAYMGDGEYLIVQDTKVTSPGARIGVLTVTPGGEYFYQPIEVDWPERAANDLESVYGFKTIPGEFLVAESGSYYKQWDDPTTEEYPGRVFHLRLSQDGDRWSAEVLQTFDIPLNLHEVEGMFAMQDSALQPEAVYGSYSNMGDVAMATELLSEEELQALQEYNELAGAAAVGQLEDRHGGLIIALATRGGTVPYEPAVIYWGYADLDTGSYELSDQGAQGTSLQNVYVYNPLAAQSPWRRGCTDLYMDDNGVLWVATSEELADAGPFRSTVYRYGKFNPSGYSDPYQYMNNYQPNSGWTIDGLKIEALAAPCIPGTVLCFATDDEDYGGVWRPLGAP